MINYRGSRSAVGRTNFVIRFACITFLIVAALTFHAFFDLDNFSSPQEAPSSNKLDIASLSDQVSDNLESLEADISESPSALTTSDDPAKIGNVTTIHVVEPRILPDVTPHVQELNSNLLPWQWEVEIADQLNTWPVINREKIELGVKRLERSVTAFRAQVIGGRLFVTDIKALWFARQYTASAKLSLLAVMRNFKGNMPDIDIVVNQGDYPVVTHPRNPQNLKDLYNNEPYPLIFSPTSSSSTLDLKWPDFSFMPPLGDHELLTPRWDTARESVLKAGRLKPWEDKLDLAAWTGNTQAEPRQRLAKVAKENPGELLVNSIFFKEPVGRKSCVKENMSDRGGYQEWKCSMSFEELCRYKYLVNVGSNGYANKLKYLFLCGSVVLHVRDGSPNHEFFESQLLPGVHYYAVSKVEEVAEAVKYLRQHPEQAQAIAKAGTERMSKLSFFEVTRYLHLLFTEYSKRMNFKPERHPDSFEVNCEDDLWRHYDSDGGMMRFLTQDNSSCLQPPQPGEKLEAPGWGGYFTGSGVPCEKANDLKEVPDACKTTKPRY